MLVIVQSVWVGRSETALRRGAVRCGLAAVPPGGTTPVAAQIADETNAPTLAGLLYVGAALVVLPVAVRTPLTRAFLRRGAAPLAVAVVAGGFLGPILLVAGLQRTPVATASLILQHRAGCDRRVGAPVLRRAPCRHVVRGTALVVVAGGLLAGSGSPELRLGAVFVVAACICWGLDNCVTAQRGHPAAGARDPREGCDRGGHQPRCSASSPVGPSRTRATRSSH